MMTLIIQTPSLDTLKVNVTASSVNEATQIWKTFDTFSDMRKHGFKLLDISWN